MDRRREEEEKQEEAARGIEGPPQLLCLRSPYWTEDGLTWDGMQGGIWKETCAFIPRK